MISWSQIKVQTLKVILKDFNLLSLNVLEIYFEQHVFPETGFLPSIQRISVFSRSISGLCDKRYETARRFGFSAENLHFSRKSNLSKTAPSVQSNSIKVEKKSNSSSQSLDNSRNRVKDETPRIWNFRIRSFPRRNKFGIPNHRCQRYPFIWWLRSREFQRFSFWARTKKEQK